MRLLLVQTPKGICLKCIREDGKELSAAFEKPDKWNDYPAYRLREVKIFPHSSSAFSEAVRYVDEEDFITLLHSFSLGHEIKD